MKDLNLKEKSDIMWEETLKQLDEGKSIVDVVKGGEIAVHPVEIEHYDNPKLGTWKINLTFKVGTEKGYIWRCVEILKFYTTETSEEVGDEGESLLTDVQRLRVVESCGYFIDGIGHILGNSKTILEKVLS